MDISIRYRTLAFLAMLSLSLPAFAQAEAIVGGIGKAYLFSLAFAFIVLVLMLLGKRTRKASLLPILLAALCSFPLVKVLIQGSGPNQLIVYSLIGAFVAPWVFVVTSVIAAVVSREDAKAQKRLLEPEGRCRLWLAVNATLPIAALLALTRPLGFSPRNFLYHFAWFPSLLSSISQTHAHLLLLALDYLLVAIVLLKIFDWVNIWRWLNPAASGMHVLLIANVIQLIIFFAPMGDQADPLIRGIEELARLYIWPSIFLALIAYLVMIKATLSKARSNPPLNTDASPNSDAPVS